MTVAIVHHPDYVAPLPAGHRFPMDKYGLLKAELDARGLTGHGNVHTPEPAPRAWLELAHDPAYVAAVLDKRLGAAAERRIGFPVTDRVVLRTRLSAGGTTLAGRLALEHGIACQTAGGSHHAHRGFGSGYCVFNDVAVATAVLRDAGAVDRVLIVDLDVHQGDGTALIFSAEPAVFTFSMHGDKNFPARKAVSDLDVALPDGTGDAEYMAALRDCLPGLIERHRPDLVFYNAGVDVHEKDKLGRLALSEDGIRARDAFVMNACGRAGVALATVVGGGYGADRDRLARLHAHVVEAAAKSAACAGRKT